MKAAMRRSPIVVAAPEDLDSVSVAAPMTPMTIAIVFNTESRSRRNTAASPAASGGNRLSNNTAWDALVSCAPSAESALVPGP